MQCTHKILVPICRKRMKFIQKGRCCCRNHIHSQYIHEVKHMPKYNMKRFKNVCVCAVLFIALGLPICSAQLPISGVFAREYLGRATSYRTGEGDIRIYKSCHHDVIKPHTNFNEITTCFKELAKLSNRRIPKHPDSDKRVDRIILDHGYNLITYDNVTSKDGYIQTLFRISGSPVSPPRKGKPAVLLLHGALGSADLWILLDQKSLAYKLADAGYDVFLLNARGTNYSQKHVKYNANVDLEYWDFSFHEVAVYDIPILFHLMLAETKTQKIFFVGYSLGTNTYMAAVAELPHLNDKIHASFLCGATITPNYTTSPSRIIAVILDLPPWLQESINIILRGQVGTVNPILYRAASNFCSRNAYQCGFCGNSLFSVTGYDIGQIPFTELPKYISRGTSTSSLKSLLHVAQNYRACKFQKYDYGSSKNLKRYGQSYPPLYNLSNLHAPIYFFQADEDDVAANKDLDKFIEELPPRTVKHIHHVNWTHFNHFGFGWGKDADVLVYNQMLDYMKQYVSPTQS